MKDIKKEFKNMCKEKKPTEQEVFIMESINNNAEAVEKFGCNLIGLQRSIKHQDEIIDLLHNKIVKLEGRVNNRFRPPEMPFK